VNKLAERYGDALFLLGKEENKLPTLKQEAEELLSAIDENCKQFLLSEEISKEEKKEIFAEVLKDGDQDLLNLVRVCIDNRRGTYLDEILKSFIASCNQELGIIEVRVISAKALNEEEKKIICEAVQKKTNKRVTLKNEVDESLLAGSKIYVGNKVYDTSLTSKIENLRSELLKGN